MTLVARVVPDVTGVDKVFDYLVPSELLGAVHLGDRVRVPLHGRNVAAWIVGMGQIEDGFSTVHPTKLRSIVKWLGIGPSDDVIAVAQWASRRWVGRLRAFFVAASPTTLVSTLPSPRYQSHNVESDGDTAVLQAVRDGKSLLVIRGPLKSPIDVVIAAASGGPTLVIIPTVMRARLFASSLRRHGFTVAVLPDEWASAAGGVDVVVGSRAAVFARVPGLKCIVVIDEHDDSLREERSPTWHARDVAIQRSAMANVSCILTSALPSVVATQWAGDRIVASTVSELESQWPQITIIDRTVDEHWSHSLLSSQLIEELRNHSRKIVVILNTKGRSRLLACGSCKTLVRCQSCDAAMIANDDHTLHCRRCIASRPYVCAKCGSAKLLVLKPGVSKLREELAGAAGRLAADVVEVSAARDAENIDQTKMLFIGTEAALHRVYEADTVVFLDIDQELTAPRYRASEIVGSLIVHASRLVGRSEQGGKVVIQTHSADSSVIRALSTLDIHHYLASATQLRRSMQFPPFGAIAQIEGQGVQDAVKQLQANSFIQLSAGDNGSYLVKAADADALSDALGQLERTAGVKLTIRVDPARV